ncbi:PIG-L deacetylase family protein [Saccharopolyspora griseoalba]|uniref:PIG-L deacetylase family protein n=1 Tax=Saccharopolyspora griseoalba TaxID=1431848 RepID=A0ABW2LRA8_9PSEU
MSSLQPFPEEWSRAVCVMAHPDDLEYGPAAAVARWTGLGREVSYLFVTSGEAGIEGTPPERAGPLREREERAAAAHVGVEDLEFLGFPDSAIRNTPELRRAIAEAVARRDPELIVLLNHHARWAFGGGNSDDHRNTGHAVLQCAREHDFPRLRWIAIADSPEIDHAVDVTATIDAGLAALREHRAYLDALGGEKWSVDHVLGNAERAGELFGTTYAAAFELQEPGTA